MSFLCVGTMSSSRSSNNCKEETKLNAKQGSYTHMTDYWNLHFELRNSFGKLPTFPNHKSL